MNYSWPKRINKTKYWVINFDVGLVTGCKLYYTRQLFNMIYLHIDSCQLIGGKHVVCQALFRHAFTAATLQISFWASYTDKYRTIGTLHSEATYVYAALLLTSIPWSFLIGLNVSTSLLSLTHSPTQSPTSLIYNTPVAFSVFWLDELI